MPSFIIANWKMNLTLKEATSFCTSLSKKCCKNLLIIAPPTPYLAYLSNEFKNLVFCSQNVSHIVGVGAYTGEYSSLIIKSCNINYTIIGHNERKRFFKENNKIMKEKIKNCLESNITPIICIGESSLTNSVKYEDYIIKQLEFLIPDTDKTLIIAYEPTCSIGTGFTLPKKRLQEIINLIKIFLKKTKVANNTHLVYGGSINMKNIKKILNLQNIDGVIIGNASLNLENFIEMMNFI